MARRLWNKMSMLLAGAALLAGMASAQAQTYDFVSQFTIASNPNGVWSYGWTPFRGGPFTLMDLGWTDYSYGTQDVWTTSAVNPSPSIALAVTDINHPTLFVPAGTVNTHPGYNGENPVVRWTAPASGTYRLEGSFIGNDHGWDWQTGVTTTTDVAVLRGPFEVFSGFVESYQNPLPFSITMPLLAGETVDLTVGFGRNSSYWHDSTGLSATFTKVSDLACTPPPAGMLGWWPGDGSAVDIVKDHNGTLENGAAFAPGIVGQAFSLDGVDDYVRAILGPEMNFGAAGDFTIDAWFKTSQSTAAHRIVLIRGVVSEQGGDGYATIWQEATTGRMIFQICDIPDDCSAVITPNIYHDGTWHHVAGVRHSSGTVLEIYIDGVLENTARVTARDIGTDDVLTIGGRPDLPQFWQGLIDEVEIYNRALTAEEVRTIYLAGSAGKCRVVNVAIDIRPGGFPSSINPGSNGVVPVAVLTTVAFDAAMVDPATVRFGATGTEAAPTHSALEDVNGDGMADLVLQFPTQNTGIVCGTTSGILTGRTTGGLFITGTDSIAIVGCK